MGSANAILKAFRGAYHGNSNLAKLRSVALGATIYLLWNARNRALFEGEKVCIEDIVRKIQILTLRCASHLDLHGLGIS